MHRSSCRIRHETPSSPCSRGAFLVALIRPVLVQCVGPRKYGLRQDRSAIDTQSSQTGRRTDHETCTRIWCCHTHLHTKIFMSVTLKEAKWKSEPAIVLTCSCTRPFRFSEPLQIRCPGLSDSNATLSPGYRGPPSPSVAQSLDVPLAKSSTSFATRLRNRSSDLSPMFPTSSATIPGDETDTSPLT